MGVNVPRHFSGPTVDYMGLTWYIDVGKDDDDLLNASMEVDVSAIVLQLVHLKQSKSQRHLQN